MHVSNGRLPPIILADHRLEIQFGRVRVKPIIPVSVGVPKIMGRNLILLPFGLRFKHGIIT